MKHIVTLHKCFDEDGHRIRGAWDIACDKFGVIARSRNPEYDAACLLWDRGWTGQMETWHEGSDHWAMRCDIETKAMEREKKNGADS